MALGLISFYQPGCIGCREQAPINTEVGKQLGITIEEIDVTENPGSVKEFHLTVTPTTVILNDSTVTERFEGVVYQEQLLEALKKKR